MRGGSQQLKRRGAALPESATKPAKRQQLGNNNAPASAAANKNGCLVLRKLTANERRDAPHVVIRNPADDQEDDSEVDGDEVNMKDEKQEQHSTDLLETFLWPMTKFVIALCSVRC